jgi:hypothetical protein
VSKLTRAMVVYAGMLRTFNVASVTIPSVPSEPCGQPSNGRVIVMAIFLTCFVNLRTATT